MNRRGFSQYLASGMLASLTGSGSGTPTLEPQTQTSTFGYGGVASNQNAVNTLTQAFAPFVALPASGLPPQMDNAQNGQLPPVGNQGLRGTCTAWGVGYAMATYREAHVRKNDPRTAENQASPEDLYSKTLLQRQLSGLNCMTEGIGIVEAIDVLKRRGIASMKDVPYNANTCQIRGNVAPV